MNDKKYLISILISAREVVTQAANKAVKALNDVSKAQEKANKTSDSATKAANEQRGALQQLYEQHVREKKIADDAAASELKRARAIRESTSALRDKAQRTREATQALEKERDAASRRNLESLKEASSLQAQARARAEQIGSIDKTSRSLATQAGAARRAANENRLQAASISSSIRDIERRAQAIDNEARSFEKDAREADKNASAHVRSSSRVATSIVSVVKQIEKFDNTQSRSSQSSSRFTSALTRIGFGARDAKTGVSGLNSEIQGLQVAAVIKYAQSLLSALIALGAQLVAVAAAAAQAGAALGAALAAGAAQAVPVVGILAAAFSRLTSVLKAVKLQNQQQLTASHDAAAAARTQRDAADSIRQAEERVQEAHRNSIRAEQDLTRARSDASREQVRAQREVTQARKDAVRTVHDLIDAEKQAQLQAEGAALSVEDAKAALRSAVRSGDVGSASRAELGVREAKFSQHQATVGVQRATQDAAPVRKLGVEGVQAVQDSEQRLADTRRSNTRAIAGAERQVTDALRAESQAQKDLSRTRSKATQDTAKDTAAVDKLADSLKQLSPAERSLYERILVLQKVYKRAARPITDIITRAFTDVVDRVIKFLQDSRILSAFRKIAVQIAASIRSILGEAGSSRSVSAFQILSAEAARNIPIATRILKDFFVTARNIVLAAVPAFRLLLTYVEGYAKQAKEASTNSKGLSDFFVTGIKYANSFFKLGLAVIRLFLAIAGRGGAAGEGIKTIDQLTGAVDDLTERVKNNAVKIREFFASTRQPFFALLGVIGAIGKELIGAFSAESVTSFTDFLKQVLIPAVGNVVVIMGKLVTVFHQLLTIPGVSQLAQMAATFLLLAKGLTILTHAFTAIKLIVPSFLRAMGLMRVAMLTTGEAFLVMTPEGWIVLAILAVVAAIVVLDRKLHFLGPAFAYVKTAAADAWDWLLKAGKSVIDWFKDVWTQGLLYWLRQPFKPFVGMVKRVAQDFAALITAAAKLVGWFKDHFGPSGEWSAVWSLITAPFKVAYAAIMIIIHAIEAIVKVFIDVVAGRFGKAGDAIKDFWNSLIDTISGGVSSMLDILGKLFGVLAKAPGGGRFKNIAEDIGGARDAIDKWREGLRDSGKATDTAGGAVETFGGKVKDTTDSVSSNFDKMAASSKKSMERVSRSANQSEAAFKQLADGGRAHLRDIREITELQMQRIAGSMGLHSKEGKDALAANFRKAAQAVQDQMDAGRISTEKGLRAIRGFLAKELQVYGLSLHEARNYVNGKDTYTGRPDNAAPDTGFRIHANATGGMANPYGGSARDDHMLIDPYGRPVAALSGTEGIVNAPQMGVINQALGISQQLGASPWGSLSDLWGSGMTHYARGGAMADFGGHPSNVSSGIKRLIALMQSKFPLQVTSTTDHKRLTTSGNVSDHTTGHAVDLSSSDYGLMNRAASYVKTSGLYKQLKQGIHNPNLAVNAGRIQTPPGQFAGDVWAQHVNHIHLAIAGALNAIRGGASASKQIRAPRILGGGAVGQFSQRSLAIATGAANRVLSSARRSVASNNSESDPRAVAMAADVNVVAAFRRAIAATKAPPKARLALWEAGIVESGLRNLSYGDADSEGALQLRVGLHGRGLARNPYASAIAFMLRGFTGKGGAIDIARRNPRMSAGMVAQAVQGSGRPLAYDQVANRARGYLNRGGMLRRLQTGGGVGILAPAKGITGPRKGARQAPLPAIAGFADVMKVIADALEAATKPLEQVAKGPLSRSKKIATRIRLAMEAITGDKGTLDTIRLGVEDIATRGALLIQKAQFSVTGSGPKRTAASPAALAQGDLRVLQQTRGGLEGEQGAIKEATKGAERALAEAKKRKSAKGIVAAQTALENLKVRMSENTAALAQNAQDQVDAIETFEQAMLDAVNTAADDFTSALDRKARVAKALGISIDPNTILDLQIGNMREQIKGLQSVLAEANRTGNVDLAKTIRNSIDELNTTIAENIAQQFQNAIDAVNAKAAERNAQIDRITRRLAIKLPAESAAPVAERLTQMILDKNRRDLTILLGKAASEGNSDQYKILSAQLDEVNLQIEESVGRLFQANVDFVNVGAQKQETKLDRGTRRAQIGGQTDFSAIQSILGSRQGIIGTQRAGLAELLGQAAASGDIKSVQDLTDQIDELDTQLIENTQAIRDNTDAAFAFKTQKINERFDFTSGVFSGAQGFFQALTQRTGLSTLPQQLTALQGVAGALQEQQKGLIGQLASLTGRNGAGLSGQDLVNWLVSIATGPTFDAIMASLDPTQQQAFKDLVSGLLSNATALDQNTQAITELTGSNAQGFSSSMWTAFRTAVFNGAGGLLPNYKMFLPSADVGAKVLTSGALMAHAGETIRPASISRGWSGGGDTYNLQVSTPTQVLDPVDVNRQLAFLRKTTGR